MAVARVTENLGGTAELEEECHALFPTPAALERSWLYEALLQIVHAVPWLPPLLGDDSIGERLRRLSESAQSAIPEGKQESKRDAYAGAFGMYGAMLGTGSQVQPPGLLALRGLLWLALHHCRRTGRPYRSAAKSFAQSLRAFVETSDSSAGRTLSPVIPRLRDSRSLVDAIAAVDILVDHPHKTLFQVWRAWLKPTLQEIASGIRPKRERQEPTEGTDPPDENRRKTSTTHSRANRADREGPSRGDPSVLTLRRYSPHPDQLPGESPGEFSRGDALISVPGYGSGAKNRKQAEYHASQAIWGGNALQITNHIDVLPADVYWIALDGLIQRLNREDLSKERAIGSVACLLKAITARTTPGILALDCRTSGWGERLNTWVLDLDAGCFTIPVYWKASRQIGAQRRAAAQDRFTSAGYFQPSPEQRKWLVPVVDLISLPLVRPLHKALTHQREVLDLIPRMEEAELDGLMSGAASALTSEIGFPVGVASLRRSLSPLLVERTGDCAQAQLICGDTFGATDSHQHYYAPRRKDLADAYFSVFEEMLGPSPAPRIPEPGTRVGSELLVSAEAAKRLARASAEHSPPELKSGDVLQRVIGEHRRLLDHLVRMLLATAGHRPAEALFELTLADIDRDSGAALFRDKRHDVAHDPRLARLPTVVIRQIGAYLRHLDHLEQQTRLAPHMRLVRAGETPLLFDLDHEGNPYSPSLQTIVRRSPSEWSALPWNWGRTYIRTRAVEMGAPAFLIAAQLGHFDSIGYPYSNQSPTDPVEVLDAVKPWLDRVAATQAWNVLESELSGDGRTGSNAGRPARESDGCSVPLKDWRPVIQSQAETAAVAHRQWERAVRTDARRSRMDAERAVLAHPAFQRGGVSATYLQSSKAALVEPLSSLDVERIRNELVLQCEDDAGAALACTRALRRILGAVARLVQQPTPTLPLPIVVRRPLDNAFFPGACQGLSHVHALRDHVRRRSSGKRPERSWMLQVARTAESLALFGWIDDPETLRVILGARAHARPSARIPDLMLVPIGEGRIIALRGVAALALASLAQSFPEEPLPDPAALDAALASLLPAWAVAGKDHARSLLVRLCSTVSVAIRFELSPAARFALDSERGSTHASLAEQLAFIDSDPVGPPRPESTASPSQADPPPSRALASPDAGQRTPSARVQYNRLVAMIPKPGQELVLPLTARTVPATAIQLAETRRLVVDEVDTWIARSESGTGERLWPIVRMLSDWTLAELVRRKADGDLLADRSVSTYLTRIGKALVDELGGMDAAQWTELDFEQAYSYALFASNDAKHKVAAALLSFHEHCAARFDLPEVDLGAVYAHLSMGLRNVDAAMILPVEREAALAELEKRAWTDAGGGLAATRVARLADFSAVFLGHAGARLNEPIGLQVRDVAQRPSGELWTRVRPNRLRSVKTRAARRVLQFGPRCTANHQQRAWRWVDSVRRRAGATRPGGAYLTAGLGTPVTFAEHSAVGDLIRQTLARSTGRRTERLHRLRHLVSTEAIAQRALSAEDAEWTGHPVLTELLGRPIQPRDLHALCVPIGHAHWMTTIQWYLHIPWLFLSRPAARLRAAYFGRQVVSAALGYTPFSLDAILRGGAGDPLRQWFDHFRPGRAPPELTQQPAAPIAPEAAPWEWTAVRVGQLVDHAWKSKDLMAALVLTGAPRSEAERIEECAAKWELKLGLRLVPEFVGERRRECPARAVRRMEEDGLIERLWQLVDQPAATLRDEIRRIAAEYFVYLMPGADHRILLTLGQAAKLTDILTSLGVPIGQILCEPAAAGMSRLEVRRGNETRVVQRYRGLGIKRVLAVVGFASDLGGTERHL